MKLYITAKAPNPRRVTMFVAEKAITQVALVSLDLQQGEHKTAAMLAKSPLAQLPVLELDDGRALTESRAICSYLEGLVPEPNLMGRGFEEHAFIEMADRRVELSIGLTIIQAVRHSHPALAPLEQPQIEPLARVQAERMRSHARLYDELLGRQAWVAGDRFTVADITLYCMLEFAKGLLRYVPGDEGLAHLQAWRDRMAERPSAVSTR